MKRQITFIITMLMLACSWGFVAAQSIKTTSLASYRSAAEKPITLEKRLKDKALTPSFTSYANPKKILEGGDIFAEQYLVATQRELDIMYGTLSIYRQWLISTQAKVAPWGSTSDCAGLTDLDVVALMSRSSDFVDRMSAYPMIQIESFSADTLDNACRKRVSCVGESARTSYAALTAAQAKRPICSDRVAGWFMSLYEANLLKQNFDTIAQYNNIFQDGNLDNAPFDIGEDIRLIKDHHFEYLTRLPDTSTKITLLSGVSTAKVTWLPDELIASTQQLLTALQVETTVDPRQDAQIASLMGQLTTVSSSSATVPTGSILNACIDPATTTQNAQVLLDQLKQSQQTTQQYGQSLNTNQSLNNVINGSIDPASLSPQPVRLSALTIPDRSVDPTVPVSYDTNPLGSALAKINDADLWSRWAWGARLSGDAGTVLGTWGASTGIDTLKQCVSSCVFKYDNNNNSPCVQTCKAKWSIWWTLSERACNQQCFNAKIACKASCLCGSTAAIADKNAGTGEVKKIHEQFEARWCVIPTNKLRNPIDKTCLRVDPDTGVTKLGSIQCYLSQTIEQWTYNRESGKWGLRIKPREWFDLYTNLKLKPKFPVTVVSSPVSKDQDKTQDVAQAQNKQQYEQQAQLSPLLVNSQLAGVTQIELWQFIQSQIKLRNDIAARAEEIKTIVEWK
jgi:hypothetical protein